MSAFDNDGFGRSPHGTEGRYQRGCRCDECKTAKSDAGRRRREQKATWPVTTPHGTVNGYNNYGCRCAECKAVKREQDRRKYADVLAFRQELARLRQGGGTAS